jgi:hypothetical protein
VRVPTNTVAHTHTTARAHTPATLRLYNEPRHHTHAHTHARTRQHAARTHKPKLTIARAHTQTCSDRRIPRRSSNTSSDTCSPLCFSVVLCASRCLCSLSLSLYLSISLSLSISISVAIRLVPLLPPLFSSSLTLSTLFNPLSPFPPSLSLAPSNCRSLLSFCFSIRSFFSSPALSLPLSRSLGAVPCRSERFQRAVPARSSVLVSSHLPNARQHVREL